MVALGLLGLGRKCLCLSKTGWNEVDGRLSWSRKDDLPPISHNCQAWTWAAVERGGRAQSQERAGSAEKPWGPVLWGELRSRGQVRRQFLQAKAWWPETRQSVRTDLNPWGTSTQQALAVCSPCLWGLCMQALGSSWVTDVRVQGQGRFLWASLYQPLQMNFRKYHTWKIAGFFITRNEAFSFQTCLISNLALSWWSRSLFKYRESFSSYSIDL